MPFIGIISNKKDFEIIKSSFLEYRDIININEKNIENLKNIKFDMMIINQDISRLADKQQYLKRIINNIKYLVINFDLKIELELLEDYQLNIISYGLNPKSTVTVSSIKDDEVLIAIQRKIKVDKGLTLEEEERKIKIKDTQKNNIYDLLVANIIKIIYDIA